jgi:hypothetical protein
MTSSVVIDLTTSLPPQQPEPNTVSIVPGDASAPDKVKQPLPKTKRRNKAPSIVSGTSERSDQPRASVEPPHPLAETKEATQPGVPPRAPPLKRKRGHADHGPAGLTGAVSEDRDRLKRHKRDQSDRLKKAPTPVAPVTSALDVSAASEARKPEKKKQSHGGRARRTKDAKEKESANNKEDGELTEAEVNNPPTTNGSSSANKKHRERSESPSRLVSKASGKKRKKKSKSASDQKATSDIESIQSSTSHMFFVDLEPTKDVVYETPEVKSKYRVEQGNLLLPHHVLLETAEKQQTSLGAIEVPPRDDTDSDTGDDFQLIENTNGVCFTFLNVDSYSGSSQFQRYFDQLKLHQVEPCEICKQVHSSKICPGLVVSACSPYRETT